MARQPHANEDQSVRLLKVGERVRHVLSELLMRQQVHDDTLSAHTISVTEVRMSPDLRQARVYAKALLGRRAGAQALRQTPQPAAQGCPAPRPGGVSTFASSSSPTSFEEVDGSFPASAQRSACRARDPGGLRREEDSRGSGQEPLARK